MFNFGLNTGCWNLFPNMFSSFGSFGGLGMFSGFGGGSIFGCGYNNNFNATIGYTCATAGLAVTAKLIDNAVQNKRENSAETIGKDVTNLNKQINAELAKLGADYNEQNYTQYDAEKEPWYTEKLAKINSDEKKITGKLDDTTLDNNNNIIKKYTTTVEEIKAREINENYTEEQKTADLKKANEEYTTANNLITAHKKALEAEEAIQTKRDALAKELEKRKNKIKEIQNKIADLIDKRNNALSDYNDAKLNQADFWGGRSFEETKKLFDENGNLKPDANIDKRAIRGAIRAYRRAVTEEEKNDIKDKFKKLYEALPADKRSAEFKEAYLIICD